MYHALLAQRVAENRPIRVGIIGTGKFGGGVVAQLSQMRGMEVAVIAEISVERAVNLHAYTVAGRLPEDALRVANNLTELHETIRSGKRAIVEDGLLVAQCELSMLWSSPPVFPKWAHGWPIMPFSIANM